MRIGTRGSALALAQARWVAQRLGADSEIVTLIVPAPPGTVWTNPAGTVSRRV